MLLLVTVLTVALFTAQTAAVNHGLNESEIAEFKPINATRIEQNTGVVGIVNITEEDTYYTVYTNAVPSHSNFKWSRPEESRPIPLNVVHTAINIPKVPKLRTKPLMCVPLGLTGVATGGVFMYNAYTPRMYCPIANLVESFDMCMGHPDPGGGYHYHGHSSCNRMEVCNQQSKIFGVAIDGIPIYGPFDENGKQLTFSDGLDICGGRYGPDGRYRYHITGDPPYFLNCLMGEIHKKYLNTTHPTPDFMKCTCPQTDMFYPECHEDPWCEDDADSPYTDEEKKAAEEAFIKAHPVRDSEKPHICKWDVGNDTDYALCNDEVVNAAYNYTPGFRQVRTLSTAKLIPCCPQGKDCGETCRGNPACYVEERQGWFLETEVLLSGTGGVFLGWLFTVLGLLNLL